MKILVVEDEEAIRMGLVDILEMEGYQVEQASDGQDALDKISVNPPALVILDVMLPKKNGYDVCRAIRKGYPGVFVLMLTAKSTELDKITGLEMGADDYMTKPFSMMEFMARVKSMARRINKVGKNESGEIRFGSICIDVKGYTATRAGSLLELSAKEIQIIEFLYKRRGTVVTREELLESIWGYSLENMPTTRTVDNQIVKIRAKIEEDSNSPVYITSIRGVGYKFEDNEAKQGS